MPFGQRSMGKIKLSSDPESTLYVDGFAGGLNTLVSAQHIQDNECSILLNGIISEDGVIGRRLGSTQYDTGTDGNKVYGLGSFTTFDSNGNPVRTLLKMDDSGNLKKLNTTTKTWSTITGHTFNTGLNTEFVQSNSACYILNGKDSLSRTDGTTVTTFATVTDPSGGLTVSNTGTAGTSNYSYAYTLVTKYGESLPCATVATTTGNATLSATNYNLLTITRSSDANVTGYNVYGRLNNLLVFMKFVPQTASGNPTYSDTGTDTPNPAEPTPTINTTHGHVFSMGVSYHDQLIAAGDPNFPSYLYFSATGYFDDFQLVDGGGFQVVNQEDGQKITAILSYKDKIVCIKDHSSYIFYFQGIQPVLNIVNPFIGCAATKTARVVVNDVYFLAASNSVFKLGYAQGYYGAGGVADLLRSDEVSIKIHPSLQTINPARIQYATAYYSVTNYKYILWYADGTSTYNNKGAVFDTRYNAWAQWDNMNINCFTQWIDASNVEHVLYGDDNAGKIVEVFSGSSDQGNSFTFRMRTKDFNAGAFHLLKTWIWPTFHFRNIQGNITTTITADGTNTAYNNTITSTTLYTGWSYDRWENYLWATTAGQSATASAADAPRQVNKRFDARSIMFLFENTSTADSFTLLGVQSRYITRVGRRLASQYILN